MNRDVGQRGGAGCEGCRQRFSLAGLHLGEHAVDHQPATEELNVVVALPQHALGGLPDDGESLKDQARLQTVAYELLTKLLDRFIERPLVEPGVRALIIENLRCDPFGIARYPVEGPHETPDQPQRCALEPRAGGRGASP